MAEKKSLCRFTVQFNPSDPSHKQTAEILNQQGRRKAQFIVNAVMHYLHCPEAPDIPQPAPLDTALIESLVRKILAEQKSENVSIVSAASERKVHKSESIQFDDSLQQFEDDGLAAIVNSLANFRK